MSVTVSLNASNQEDWIIQFTGVDDSTGNDIDFSTATISFKLRDRNDCVELTASTTAGTITTPTVGLVQITIPVASMKTLCAGQYLIGCVYELNSVTAQLFNGTADIYDGIATI